MRGKSSVGAQRETPNPSRPGGRVSAHLWPLAPQSAGRNAAPGFLGRKETECSHFLMLLDTGLLNLRPTNDKKDVGGFQRAWKLLTQQ